MLKNVRHRKTIFQKSVTHFSKIQVMLYIVDLPEDLQRRVWYEYIDRLRVRMLHYQLTQKFRHWRSLPMATHAGMIQDITEYIRRTPPRKGRLMGRLVIISEFRNSGWDPATSEWFDRSRYFVRHGASDYSDVMGNPDVLTAYHDVSGIRYVHAAWWQKEYEDMKREHLPDFIGTVWFP